MSESDASAAARGLASRQVAWQVLQAVAAGAYADGALERELGRANLSPRDRALATELAYGAIRQRRMLDAWLDQLGKVPAVRQPPKLRWLVHLGLYQLLCSDRLPDSAVVSTTVELAKRGGLARLAPVVNAMLRSCVRQRDAGQPPAVLVAASTDAATALGVRHSLPDWLVQLLLQWLSEERAEAFGRACNTPPSLDLRVNRLRASRDQVQQSMAAAGVECRAIEGLSDGLTLLGRSGDLRALPGYEEGHWCVQDRAAQCIAPLLDPQPGQLILDACAAPGGKSTHLAELIGDQGQVVALDRAEARLRRVVRNSERLGLRCVEPHQADAAQWAQQHPQWLGRFDRILVDAPCSGLGTLARHADARWRIAPDAIDALTVLQRQLLEGLLPLLKPGGLMVYATCTVHPAENSALIDSFLGSFSGLALEKQFQSWPGEMQDGGDGFFAAVMRLNESC